MITFYKKLSIGLMVAFFLATIPAFLVRAQVGGGGDCHVTSAVFRTSRPINEFFYDDENQPFVYVDIQTQNCVGETVEVSITEDDMGVDDDISVMDDLDITVPANNFSISLKAGENECQSIIGVFDCDYHLETWDEVESGHEWYDGPQLKYECDVTCINGEWMLYGVSDYLAFNNNDLDYSSDGGISVPPGGGGVIVPPGGGGVVVPPGSTATTSTSPTIYNLGLTNPLAGTVDTLPALIYMIVTIIIKIGIPLVAIAILYSGFLFATALGSEKQLETARKTLLYAVIGGLILLGAWLIADAIKEALISINNAV